MRLNSKKAKYLRKMAKAQIEGVENIKWFNGYSFDQSKRPNQQKTFAVINALIQKMGAGIEVGSEKIQEVIQEAQSYIFPPMNVASPSGKALYRNMKRSVKTASV